MTATTATTGTSDDERLRYPVGRFSPDAAESREELIRAIEELPGQIVAAVRDLDESQLETPYRPGGWTVRQLVHHLPDSHANAYIRFKLALTEDRPTIKPYDEARWAELADTREVPIDVSLRMLDAVHRRWVAVLRAMNDADYARGYVHPDHGRLVPLGEALAMYAWHSRHHLAHITRLRDQQGW